MAPNEAGNGWDEWRNHVLSELKENKEDHKTIITKMDGLSLTIAALQVRSGVWGLLGGLVPVLIMVIIWYVERGT